MRLKQVDRTENLQFLLDIIEKPTGIIDLQGKLLKVNKAFWNVFGVGEENCMEQIVADESLETWKAILQRIVSEQKVICKLQMVFSQINTYSVNVSLHFDETTNHIVVHLYLPHDLNNLSQHNVNNLTTKSEELVIICDTDGRIQSVNGLTEDFFGQSQEIFLNNKIEQVLSLFPKQTMDLKVLEREIEETGYTHTVQQYVHTSGRIRYYKMSIIKDVVTNLLLVKFKDQTKETILQQQLTHKDSLLEVGQLAASIAHEIRNPITTLKGFTQLLKVTAEEETLKYLNVIDDEIQRMELILSEMLNLSKPAAQNKKVITLNCLLENIVRIIYPKATLENIKVVQNYDLNIKMCLLGEEGRLKQVFLNLLKNSIESMRSGGTLTVCTQKCEGNYVNVIIQDSGKGINEHNLNQIFKPYFTTRSDGTGLGLPFVLKTVEDHEGTISVSSEVNKGTSFILTFPLVEQTNVLFEETVHEVVG